MALVKTGASAQRREARQTSVCRRLRLPVSRPASPLESVRLCVRPNRWKPRAIGNPGLVASHLEPELLVANAQVSVAIMDDRARHDLLDLLSHHTGVDRATTVIDEAIEAQAVVEVPEKDDVMLE